MSETAYPKNNRIWIAGLSIVLLLVAVIAHSARTERHYRLSSAEHLTLVIDSISYRSDLTRVYGKFIGIPHTSQKVKELQIESNGRTYKSTDIDGVDFDRWFQWEDDGIIPVEIDFGRMPVIKKGKMTIITARGTDVCTISR
jgi:hypothetical protein